MNKFVKIELLKYARQFILNEKFEIAKSFINQIINKTKNKSEIAKYEDLLNDLKQKETINSKSLINKIDIIIKKELSDCGDLDNSIN